MSNTIKIWLKKAAVVSVMVSPVAFVGGCGGGNTAPINNSSSTSTNTSSSTTQSTSSSSLPISSSSFSSSSVPGSVEGNLVVAINAGGQAGTFAGISFERDQFFNGGSLSDTADPINGTTDDGLYQTERWGSYSYEIPVTQGQYSLKLHFAEIYHESAGLRSFNVNVEGSSLISEMDLFASAGHDGALQFEVSSFSVSDGAITIELEGLVDNATISGIEVYSPNGELNRPDIPVGGGPRTMGYLGCSMSVNVAEGYEMLGGERLWPPIGAYNGQVVQNWANTNDNVWSAFEGAINQYGTPSDVWVMLCIFDNQVTLQEARTIVSNVRQRVPNANIYISGQPVYDDPNSCFLAGNGGPDKTDRIAREAANDSSLNISFAGTLGPLAGNENSDGCHANDAGRRVLGQQFIDWFGL